MSSSERISSVAILGAGKMGGALAQGFASAQVLQPSHLTLFDAVPAASAALADRIGPGCTVAKDAESAAREAQIVLFAVKPPQTLPLLKTLELRHEQIVVSIAAGVTLPSLIASRSAPGPCFRVMPNTPALIRQGAIAISSSDDATSSVQEQILRLFSAVGYADMVDEKRMDAVTGLSGSGPAYVFLFLEAMVDAGVAAGLPREIARKLSMQTLRGAAELAWNSDAPLSELRAEVTTPGGTTAAGLAALERSGLRAAVLDAVDAASRRSGELAS